MGEGAPSSPIGGGYSLVPLSAPLTAASIQEVLFDLDSYKCSSKHNNLIAFSFEVALLLRVLRSAGATDSDALEVGVHLQGPSDPLHLSTDNQACNDMLLYPDHAG